MGLMFIGSVIESDWEHLKALSLVLVIFYFCILMAILVDLCAGVDKAKRNGEARTSYGLRRTIHKIRDYFSVIMLFTLADIVASVWFTMPFFTAVGTIAMVFIEAKSVYENKKDINKGIKDLPDVLLQILKNKDKTEELVDFLQTSNKVDLTKENKVDT